MEEFCLLTGSLPGSCSATLLVHSGLPAQISLLREGWASVYQSPVNTVPHRHTSWLIETIIQDQVCRINNKNNENGFPIKALPWVPCGDIIQHRSPSEHAEGKGKPSVHQRSRRRLLFLLLHCRPSLAGSVLFPAVKSHCELVRQLRWQGWLSRDWWPEFKPWVPRGGGRKETPSSCPLTSTHRPYPPTTHWINSCNF